MSSRSKPFASQENKFRLGWLLDLDPLKKNVGKDKEKPYYGLSNSGSRGFNLGTVGKGNPMEETGKRPGGLTALAVINFVIGGILFLSVLSYFGGKYAIDMAEKQQEEIQQRSDPNRVQEEPYTTKQRKDIENAKQIYASNTIRILTLLNVIPGALLIISGVGYLKQKKTLGRTIGNLYAVISIILGIAGIAFIDKELGGGFGISSLIGFIYPVLTLFLMNVTFKEDFVE